MATNGNTFNIFQLQNVEMCLLQALSKNKMEMNDMNTAFRKGIIHFYWLFH